MNNDINVKVHRSYRSAVAICDSNLVGKIFEEGERELNLSTGFFEGEAMNENKVKEQIDVGLREDATFFIVGEKSIAVAKELEIIEEDGVMKLENIPFALVLL